MPHYLFQGRYTSEAMKAMIAKPQDREAAARQVVEAVGAKLLFFAFCFGQDDVVALVEAPDDEAMAGAALAIGASGALSGGATTKLLTSKEAMAAMSVAQTAARVYRPATA